MPLTRFAPLLALLIVAAAAAGCNYFKELNLPLITQEGKQLDGEDGVVIPIVDAAPAAPQPRVYPEGLELADPLDIEVIRVDNAIIIDNRTVRSYPNVQLWLNREYGADLDAIPVGRGEAISLQSFVNHFGERYPVARFLQPDASKALVLADLVIDGKIHKLTTRLVDDFTKP